MAAEFSQVWADAYQVQTSKNNMQLLSQQKQQITDLDPKAKEV